MDIFAFPLLLLSSFRSPRHNAVCMCITLFYKQRIRPLCSRRPSLTSKFTVMLCRGQSSPLDHIHNDKAIEHMQGRSSLEYRWLDVKVHRWRSCVKEGEKWVREKTLINEKKMRKPIKANPSSNIQIWKGQKRRQRSERRKEAIVYIGDREGRWKNHGAKRAAHLFANFSGAGGYKGDRALPPIVR